MSADDARPDLPAVLSAVAIRSYMRNSGWRESTQGTVGSVWTKGDAKFCVPHEGDDPELIQRALVRLASAEGRTPEATAAAIAEYRDARGSEMTAGVPVVTSSAPAPAGRPGTATGPAEGNWRERAERAEAQLAAVADFCTSAGINYGLVKAAAILAITGTGREGSNG